MKLMTRHLPGSNIRVLLAIIFGAMMANSCKKAEFTVPVNVGTIRFSANAYTIDLNAPNPLTITMPLSLPLEEDATAVITIDTSSTALPTEYVVTPTIPTSGLTLNLAKGATEMSFTVASLNNFEGERTVVFKLSTATGGLTVANTNATATVTIKGKPIVLPAITTSVASLPNFGSVITTTSSAAASYTVSGVKLSSNITITASANFQVSLNNTTFSSSVNIGFAAANAAPVTVYARFSPNTGINQGITGTITHSSGTVPDAIVNVSGVETGNASLGVLIAKDDLNFGTTAGALTTVSSGTWTAYSQPGANAVQYISPGLSYSGYVGSGIGGALISENRAANSEDVAWAMPSQTSGTIYAAQLLNFTSAPATQDFFSALGDPSATPLYFNRLYAKSNGAQCSIGLSRNATTTPVYSTTAYDYGTTYLVVTKYEFVTGNSTMYILSGAIPAIEPATPAAVSTGTGADPASLTRFLIRQSTNSPLKVTVDGIRIATSWKQAVGL